MKFAKWEGLGNDFIVVTSEPSTEDVRRLCDRRRGVGADGVLWLCQSDAQLQMVVLNADGTRPEMCGNGLRCVVGYHAQQQGAARGEIDVLTDAGLLGCSYNREEDGYAVTCDMGPTLVGEQLSFGGLQFQHLSVGNPHLVTFDDFNQDEFERLGRALQLEVPGGVNVEFCGVNQRGIRVLVWERGVGPTQACGTGACAVVAAAVAQERVAAQQAVAVELPGGTLRITIEANGHATMAGPARQVFSGVWHSS